MHAESDYDLTPDQWEALKALRTPVSTSRAPRRHAVEDLVALELIEICAGLPAITPLGRKVLIRGSSRLWDVAA